MPDNEFYDSDEGEAQGAGGNIKSGHERNYNDDSKVDTPLSVGVQDIQISQDEEEQIAKALKEETNTVIKIEHTDNIVLDNNVEQDTLMTGNNKFYLNR